MTEPSDIIIGIDLGTTNSLVAIADETGPRLVCGPGGDDDVMVPSVVAFDDGRVTVGGVARAHAVERPLTTIHSVKRLMGKGLADLTEDVVRLPYRLTRRRDGEQQRDVVAVDVEGRLYTPPQISAMILRELKARAERHLCHSVGRAVITVPAYFDDAQRQATRDAGRIAGLDVVRIVNEPTAAALAYGLDHSDRATIAVYDLGGGTFDISILHLDDGVFEVVATDGDTHLGGDDFDQTLIDLFSTEIREQFGVDITTPAIKQQLRTLAERIKTRLSDEDSASIEIAIGTNRTYRRTVTREMFESMITPLVDRTISSCSRAMSTARLRPEAIDEVVLVGGSSRIPFVRRRVAEVFRCRPYTALNPDRVVALGAAMQAAILSGTRRDMLLLDVTPLSLGIETLGGAMGRLIAANTRIPCQATETFTTFQDGQTAVKINVLQGERELASNCRSLGVFELRDVPPMPAGIPKVDVTFLIDQNGILNVSAVEQRSGKAASVQIIPSHGLTRDEVKRLHDEALTHARDDMTAHHLVDVRTTLRFDLNKTEQMIERFGHLIDEKERAKLTAAVAELRRFAEESDDPKAINERREAFNHSTTTLAELAMTATLCVEENGQSSNARQEAVTDKASSPASGS